MYLDKQSIASIQLDHTSRCNLMCPQCARVTHEHKINPRLEMKDLTLENYKTIFTPFIGKKLNILHCGNYGDVIASPTFDETSTWMYENGFLDVTILTNGSARNVSWWEKIAKQKVTVHFSIDGLSDTNGIYRVNSNFNKVIENAKAFINAGGKAIWDYLVFDHNEHQLETAKRLATELGFFNFNQKNTTRFVSSKGHMPTITTKKLETVTDRKNNTAVSDFNNIVEQYGSFNEYVRNTPIECKYQNLKRYYIDFNMQVWPCCWVGAPGLFYSSNEQSIDIEKLYVKYGREFNRLDIHGWDGVVSHEFYQSYLEHTWNNSNDRIYTCGRTCGTKFEFSSGYGKNVKVIKLNDKSK